MNDFNKLKEFVRRLQFQIANPPVVIPPPVVIRTASAVSGNAYSVIDNGKDQIISMSANGAKSCNLGSAFTEGCIIVIYNNSAAGDITVTGLNIATYPAGQSFTVRPNSSSITVVPLQTVWKRCITLAFVSGQWCLLNAQ